MADFKQAKFGDKFKFKKTGEICEYIGLSDNSVHLRPTAYTGLMVYAVVIDCLNAKTDWELYEEEDNWNWKFNCNVTPQNFEYMKILKNKIIDDIRKIDPSATKNWDSKDFITIITKRMGF